MMLLPISPKCPVSYQKNLNVGNDNPQRHTQLTTPSGLPTVSSSLKGNCLFHWYNKANMSTEDLGKNVENLKQCTQFSQFEKFLTELDSYQFIDQVNPKEVVEIIQSIIRSPLVRELVFYAVGLSDQTPIETFQKIKEHINFEQLCISWFKKADKSEKDLPQAWQTLSHVEKLPNFTILLEKLAHPELASKVKAKEMVSIIQVFITFPLSRELIMLALNNWDQSTDRIYEKALNKIIGYVEFGEQCGIWLKKAKQSLESFPTKWEDAKSPFNINEFSELLTRLHQTRKVAPIDVIEVLQSFIKSSSIRHAILNESDAAAADCNDRPASIFITIRGMASFGKLEEKGASPQRLFAKAKEEVSKYDALKKATIMVMTQQWKEGRLKGNNDDMTGRHKLKSTGPFLGEALECHMDLCHQLRNELRLYVIEPQLADRCIEKKQIAKLEEKDKLLAKKHVNELLQDQQWVVDNLTNHTFWVSYVEQLCQKQIQPIKKTFHVILEALESAYDCKKKIGKEEYGNVTSCLNKKPIEIKKLIQQPFWIRFIARLNNYTGMIENQELEKKTAQLCTFNLEETLSKLHQQLSAHYNAECCEAEATYKIQASRFNEELSNKINQIVTEKTRELCKKSEQCTLL